MGKKKEMKKVTKKEVKPTIKLIKTAPVAKTVSSAKVLAKLKISKNNCGDKNCPIHGHLKTRGRVFEGMIVSDKMQKTVSVQWERQVLVPKYERYLEKNTKLKAHNPACLSVKKGEFVRIAECRPISKTVNFVVIERK